ncbi:MAG: hypothetical protein A3B68_02205 [Candidatus Melainabacteria bacterium RIFCSPHIGHO2_02_FULL_34_12]|nr:MAG: hypothetical protein A3B68_02205 [Candidatus Melainabacteria bacterium RIFCSPHIGHO2_02_FULL_34_12]
MRTSFLLFNQITPSRSFITRPSDAVLNSLEKPSEEPEGYLVTSKGRARIQFLTASDELAEDTQLGKSYFGQGIYILNYYKPGNDIPIWVVEEPGKLSVSRAREILEAIKLIIENQDINASDFWTLNGKRNNPLGINDYRVSYPFNFKYLSN